MANGWKRLKILAVFTLGSATGLVTLSHLARGMLLKHYKKDFNCCNHWALLLGLLGVLWPWKRTIFKTWTVSEHPICWIQ